MLTAALITKAVFSLILVICLILITAYLARAWQNYRGRLIGQLKKQSSFLSPSSPSTLTHPTLEIIETRALDFKRKLVLVRCGDRFHLLLCGESRDIVVDHGILHHAPGPDDKSSDAE